MQVDRQIVNDLHFAELYAYTAFDEGTSLEDIKEEFGKRATKTVNDMIAKQVLYLDSTLSKVYPGNNRATYSHDVICELIKSCVSQVQPFSKMIEGQRINYINFQNMNIEGLKELVLIEDQSYKRKLEIINNPNYQGKIKAFTLGFTDYIPCNHNEFTKPEPAHDH